MSEIQSQKPATPGRAAEMGNPARNDRPKQPTSALPWVQGPGPEPYARSREDDEATREPANDVSVCLIVYNHVEVLGETIESILDQDVTGFEIIISDDHSTDGSWELIQSYAERFPSIRAVRTPRNLGMCGNANFAVAHATRPCIALLHHDDVCHPSLLASWVRVLRAHPEIGFVFNDYDEGAAGALPSHAAEGRRFAEFMSGREFLENVLLRDWGSPVRGTAMIRRSAWEAVGGLREQFGMLADVDLWMRLSARFAVGYVNRPLLRVRHARPSDYPEEYKVFRWSRIQLLYDIHAENLRSHFGGNTRAFRRVWTRFRIRVSLETLKWLLYAVVRRRPSIVADSRQAANPYEFAIVKGVRNLLIGRLSSESS